MRLSQPQGLPIEAMEFLSKNAVKVNQCPHCHRHDVGYQRKVIGMMGCMMKLSYINTLLRMTAQHANISKILCGIQDL